MSLLLSKVQHLFTDFLGIRQIEIFHDLDELIESLGEARIVALLLPHAALELTSVSTSILISRLAKLIYNR